MYDDFQTFCIFRFHLYKVPKIRPMNTKSRFASILFSFFFVCWMGNARAQTATPKDKGIYFYLAPINFLLDKEKSADNYYTVPSTAAIPVKAVFVRFEINEKKQMIVVNWFEKDKVQLTTELYNYTDKVVIKNGVVSGENEGRPISWSVIATSKLE